MAKNAPTARHAMIADCIISLGSVGTRRYLVSAVFLTFHLSPLPPQG